MKTRSATKALPLRKATARDRRRSVNYFSGGPCCLAEDRGWECSLKRRHVGNHEAWACSDDTDHAEDLCHEWPNKPRAKRKSVRQADAAHPIDIYVVPA